MSEQKQVPTIAQLETKMLRYNELNDEKKRIELEQELLKKTMLIMMKEHKLFEHRVGIDGTDSDVKAVVGSRTTTKVDKEELATDLGISIEAAGKKDVLIKQVEEGKLTFSQYKEYEYEETVETLSIRKVNA